MKQCLGIILLRTKEIIEIIVLIFKIRLKIKDGEANTAQLENFGNIIKDVMSVPYKDQPFYYVFKILICLQSGKYKINYYFLRINKILVGIYYVHTSYNGEVKLQFKIV